MARELKNIKTTEVSFVDEPAIKRKFLFFKSRGEGQGAGGQAQGDGGAQYCVCPQCGYSETHEKAGEGKSVPCTETKCPECGAKMKGSNTKVGKKQSFSADTLPLTESDRVQITIDTNGTTDGTSITVNGEKLDNLRSFSFSLYPEAEPKVSCSYTKAVETDDDFQRTETYYLMKGNDTMDTELITLLKEYFGEDIKIDVEKKEELSDKTLDAVKGALKLVNKYKADFPDDLKKAVGTLAKYAGYGYGYPAKKEKVSKAEPDSGQPNEPTSKTSDPSEIQKSIEELTKSIEKLEQEKNQQAQKEISKTLEALSKRLEAVEKGTGIKKSVEGQDDDNESKVSDPWPSIKITD